MSTHTDTARTPRQQPEASVQMPTHSTCWKSAPQLVAAAAVSARPVSTSADVDSTNRKRTGRRCTENAQEMYKQEMHSKYSRVTAAYPDATRNRTYTLSRHRSPASFCLAKTCQTTVSSLTRRHNGLSQSLARKYGVCALGGRGLRRTNAYETYRPHAHGSQFLNLACGQEKL